MLLDGVEGWGGSGVRVGECQEDRIGLGRWTGRSRCAGSSPILENRLLAFCRASPLNRLGTGLRRGDGFRSLGSGLPGCVAGWLFQSGFGAVVRHRLGVVCRRLTIVGNLWAEGYHTIVLPFNNKRAAFAVVAFIVINRFNQQDMRH